jgi:hypothetical protein
VDSGEIVVHRMNRDHRRMVPLFSLQAHGVRRRTVPVFRAAKIAAAMSKTRFRPSSTRHRVSGRVPL